MVKPPPEDQRPPPFTPELVLAAYREGLFPMAEDDGTISWYRPDPRTVFQLDQFHVPRRLARTVRSRHFSVTVNGDFGGVMTACAERSETWISADFMDVYGRLHQAGFAHSVECRRDGELVGGLYGVAMGGAFMGESMFSHQRDASKVALVALVARLRARGYVLLDTQFNTSHLARFGATSIPASAYQRMLKEALAIDTRFA